MTAAQKRYVERNRAKINRRNKEWRENNPERSKEIAFNCRLKRKYGITREVYDGLLEKQGGKCAICHQTCKSYQRLGVDHDHETGKVRGLLCLRCNRCLGLLDDDPSILRAGAVYLEVAV